jgi:hypothetical protein
MVGRGVGLGRMVGSGEKVAVGTDVGCAAVTVGGMEVGTAVCV